jgi:hypothetical protein
MDTATWSQKNGITLHKKRKMAEVIVKSVLSAQCKAGEAPEPCCILLQEVLDSGHSHPTPSIT